MPRGKYLDWKLDERFRKFLELTREGVPQMEALAVVGVDVSVLNRKWTRDPELKLAFWDARREAMHASGEPCSHCGTRF